MKKLTTVLTALLIMLAMGINAQDLNDAGKAYNKAIELSKENKTYEAIEKYQECADISAELGEVGEGLKVKAETQITSLYMKLGVDAYKAKTYDTAISLFKLSAEKADASGNDASSKKAKSYIATSLSAKGNNLYREKKYEDAVNTFAEALEYNPKYFKAYYGKAICYNKMGNTEGLEESVNKVIELGGEDKTVEKSKTLAANYFLNLSGKAIQAESYTEAAMLAKKCTEYNYLEPTAYYYMALSYNNLGSYNDAVKAAEGGLKAQSDDQSNLYFELGRAYEGIGETAKACEAYGKVTDGPNVSAAEYQRTTVLSCN